MIRSEKQQILASPGVPRGEPDVGFDGVLCRGARAMLGISQADLSAAAGCGRSLLNDFENGSRRPKGSSLNRIMSALEAAGLRFVDCGDGLAIRVAPGRAPDRTARARSLEAGQGGS